jgi:hypothetical protein
MLIALKSNNNQNLHTHIYLIDPFEVLSIKNWLITSIPDWLPVSYGDTVLSIELHILLDEDGRRLEVCAHWRRRWAWTRTRTSAPSSKRLTLLSTHWSQSNERKNAVNSCIRTTSNYYLKRLKTKNILFCIFYEQKLIFQLLFIFRPSAYM